MNGSNGPHEGRPGRRPGQILLPALFVIPSLMLFVYLLFETTKLSREKIRQQFAVDSAAFIQMGDYTNLLNRTAYVNGAFPYRIFKEAYECPPENPMQMSSGSGEMCPYDMLYAAGAFPKSKSDVKGAQPSALDGTKKWEIAFDESARPDINKNTPVIAQNSAIRNKSKNADGRGPEVLHLITHAQGAGIMLEWGTAIGYYKFYSQVYSLLGSVEESQYTVFERLTDNFNFFRKSYYLNANTTECVDNPQSCGNDGVFSSGGFKSSAATLRKNNGFHMHYVEKIVFFAKVFTGGSLPPYYMGESTPPMNMTSMTPDGLFQLATVTDDRLLKFRDGIDVYQGWDAPANYFNVDLNTLGKCKETGRPCVHSLVTSQCPQMGSGNNCVWPNPTPKYQTRLYP